MILFDIISHLLISLFVIVVLWPYLGAVSVFVVLIAVAYLVNAWMDADLIVARKAGFRRPTLVQQRYLEYLDTGQEVFTHPSLLPIAGTLASSKRQLILLTTGLINELSENDMGSLIGELSSIDNRPISRWTFHLATGGVSLFSRVDRDDLQDRWGHKTLMVGVIGGVVTTTMALLIAAPISMAFGRPIDISPVLPVFWLPLIYLVARFVWRRVHAMLIKTAAGDWNRPITLEKATLMPMSIQLGGHANLNLLRHGLLIAETRHLPSLETEADLEHLALH